VAPYDAMIAALVSAGALMQLPQIYGEPPFVSHSLRAVSLKHRFTLSAR
jgi:hypothetical protein